MDFPFGPKCDIERRQEFIPIDLTKEAPMAYDFDTPIDRRGTHALKYEKYENTDILPMWVADMDFSAPPEVLEALQKAVSHGVLGYTNVPAELNTVVQERLHRLYDWDVETDWLVWIPGVVSGLNACCRALVPEGKAMVTTTPIYPPFLSVADEFDRELIQIPMVQEGQRAVLDYPALEAAFKKGVSLLLFCSPYNPCGTLFTREELERLVELCARYEVRICSDEIHSDFILSDRPHIPTGAVSPDAADRSVTLMAPSKTFNIPGLSCSFAVIPNPESRRRFKAVLKGLVPDVNSLGYFGALAAYSKGDAWLEELIAYLSRNRDRVVERINQMPGLKLNPIESTFLAWIDARETGLEDPVAFFEAAGVGLSDGKYFGNPGFIRLNYGCPFSVLEQGLDRMAAALAEKKDVSI